MTTPSLVLIAGAGRSGSTLLGDILGQIHGCSHVGEVRFLFRSRDHGGRRCGCGALVVDCERWNAIRARSLDGPSPSFDRDSLEVYSYRGLRYRGPALVNLWFQSRQLAPRRSPEAQYSRALASVYSAIREVTGAETVIDSSKIAMHVHLASRLPHERVHVVHLIRDPRAIAYSWRRGAVDDNASFGPARAAASWTLTNLAAATMGHHPDRPWRYTLLRYEDLVTAPTPTLTSLTRDLGLAASDLPLVSDRVAQLGVQHTLGGNPARFRRGDVPLVPDEEWRSHMSMLDRLGATLTAGPLMGRYGYGLRRTGHLTPRVLRGT